MADIEINSTTYSDVATVTLTTSSGSTASYLSTDYVLVGTPTVVDTVSDMTDTTLIYVYVGSESGYSSGYWYYYDGTDWVAGGEYGTNGGINDNARNLLKYILNRVAYTETDMQAYINALYYALAETGTTTGDYTILNTLSYVTNSNTGTSVNSGDSYVGTLTADDGYTMSTVTVTMSDTDITSDVYDSSTGLIAIESVTGDVEITASATSSTVTYTITNALTNVTNSNEAASCTSGDSYSATLTADTNYELGSVTVTMGGTDVTSDVYSDGTITIASVTGDVVITAEAVVSITFMAYASVTSSNGSVPYIKLGSGQSTRGAGVSEYGTYPLRENSTTGDYSSYYPIEIPSGATGMTLYHPDLDGGCVEIYYSGSDWIRLTSAGWLLESDSSTHTYSFANSSTTHIIMPFRQAGYTSGGTVTEDMMAAVTFEWVY